MWVSLLFAIVSILVPVYIHDMLNKRFPQSAKYRNETFDAFVAVAYVVVFVITFGLLSLGWHAVSGFIKMLNIAVSGFLKEY